MKIAIIHDWLVSYGGGERVVEKLHQMFPEATIYTSVFDSKMQKYYKDAEIKTSFIQKLPFSTKLYKWYLPLMPMAFEEFDLSEYDLVISSSSCCAKGVNVKTGTLHICYCHTPMRYAWDMYNQYNHSKNHIKRFLIAHIMHKLRMWDKISSDRVDIFIANSQNVANRIYKHYRRKAEIIYPPIKEEFFGTNSKEHIEDYYLVVTRFVAYKTVDIIIKAFNENGKKLIIIGTGPDEKKLKKMAKENIVFLKGISDEELKMYYRKCKAFLFMAEEDFGMVMAEAQASGRPVIAYKKGGAKEIVIEGITGVLIDRNVEEIDNAIKEMEKNYLNYNSDAIIQNAKRFSEKNFELKLRELIEKGDKT